MKPFDLEKALNGAKVVTRDGRPVKIAGYNHNATNNQNILGWVHNQARIWKESGACLKFTDTESNNFDLFMAPTEHTEWIVRWEDISKCGRYLQSSIFEKSIDAITFAYNIQGASIHEITVTT